MKQESNIQFIGSRIRSAREDMGLSQLDLAKALGFESATAISLIEAGERNIAVDNLERLASTLHRDVKFFLGERQDAPIDVRVALRADKDLRKEDRDAILHFIELAKQKNKKDGK